MKSIAPVAKRESRLSVNPKRLPFIKALQNGDTIEQAAERVDIGIRTAYRWFKQARGMSDIASKEELARHLTNALADSPVQYKAALAEKLAKVMGYEAPRQVELSDRTPRVSLRELLAIWSEEHIAPAISTPIQESESSTTLKALSPKDSGEGDITSPYRTLASPTGADCESDGGRSPQASSIGGALSNSHTAANSDNRS